LQSYSGKLIHFAVLPNRFDIRAATEDEEREWLAARESAPRIEASLRSDFAYNDVVRLIDVPERCIGAIGAKAENLRRLNTLPVPNINSNLISLAFVIPFHFFREFTQLVAPDEYGQLQRGESDTGDLSGALVTRIQEGRIGAWGNLEGAVMGQIAKWRDQLAESKGLRCDGVILRSSSNCEDLPRCPSAGIYHSELVDEFDWSAIERGILRVWASVFTRKAVAAR
jgi:hypothetical protein